MRKNNKVSPSIFHGYKNSELVYCDNEAYRNFMIFLEWDENVWTYFQPSMHIVLAWRENEQMYINIDFQVERADNRIELVHFFSDEQLDEEVWSRANSYARAFNMEFVPFRVMDILEEPRCSNLQMLWKDARLEILSIHTAMLNKFFREESQPDVKKLRNALTTCGFDFRLVNTFIFHKAVIADVENNPINEKTALQQNLEFKASSRTEKLNGKLDDRFTFF
jgi:hypothetical protein